MTHYCRTCFEPITNSTYVFEAQRTFDADLSIKQKLAVCVPFLDVDFASNFYICNECSLALDFVYKFLQLCTRTESKLRNHIQDVTSGIDWCDLGTIINNDLIRNETRGSANGADSPKPDVTQEPIEIAKLEPVWTGEGADEQLVTGLGCAEANPDENGEGLQNEFKLFKCFVKLIRLPEWVTSAEVINLSKFDHPDSKFEAEVSNEVAPNRPDRDNIHDCTVCDRSFPKLYRLKAHMAIHTSRRPFKCHLCNSSFKQSYHLKRHIRRHLVEENALPKPYVCTVCGRAFMEAYRLKRHVISHSTEKPFKCPLCGVALKHTDTLKRHLQVHRKNSAKNESFDFGHGDKPFKCRICSSSFKYHYNLRRHLRRHMMQKDALPKLQSCMTCGRTFKGLYDLRRHMISHSTEKPHKCQLCSTAFKMADSLKRHMRVHGNDYKPGSRNCYDCTECDRSFPELYRLKAHMVSHSSEKPFECHVCKLRFKQLYHLKRHILRMHVNKQISGENHDILKCGKCEAEFKERQYLLRHIRRRHRNDSKQADTNASPECTQDDEETVERHKCVECGTEFKQRRYLLRHNRKYHSKYVDKLKPKPVRSAEKSDHHECAKCGITFKQRRYLLRHNRKYHSNSEFESIENRKVTGIKAEAHEEIQLDELVLCKEEPNDVSVDEINTASGYSKPIEAGNVDPLKLDAAIKEAVETQQKFVE